MRRKSLSIFLVLMMVMSLMPVAAFAENTDATPAGGSVIYVDATNGNDDNENVGTSMGTAYKTLETAVNAAKSGDTIQLAAGTYTLYEKDADVLNKDLTFIGAGTEQTSWLIGPTVPDPAKFGTEYNSDYSFDVRSTEAKETVTFKNMTLQSGSVNYLGFAGADNTVVENCVIDGMTFYWGYTSATFKNTTFNCPQGDYAIWTYATQVETFEGCTFNGSGKFINVYGDSGINQFDSVVYFKDCTVNDASESGNKPVLNINDSNKGDHRYIINISGNNTLNGVKTDNISCSRLFGFSGRASNSTGRSVVSIEGTTVWQDGKRTHGHNTEVQVDGGSYDNGVSGETDLLYTDGFKDGALTTSAGEWVNQDGLNYRIITTVCDYCGYEEDTYEYETIDIEIPFSKIVEKGGNVNPDEQSFELEVVQIYNGDVEEHCSDVTVNAIVDTQGEGQYKGKLVISGPSNQVMTYISEGFVVHEKNDGAAYWSYDDTVWAVIPVTIYGTDESAATTEEGSEEQGFAFYPAKLVESEEGTFYDYDEEAPADAMTFTNIYTRNISSGGGGGGGGGVINTTTYYFALDKVDARDNSALGGARFGLFLDGKQIATATSNDDGKAIFRLSPSDYSKITDDSELYYQELIAPEGYTLSSIKTAIKKSDFHRNSQSDALKNAATVKNYSTATATPSDLNADDHVAYVHGYPDGTVKPQANVTRAETATMLYNLLTNARREALSGFANSNSAFSDVTADLWYKKQVTVMANGEYIKGYPDGTFGGDKRITRAEFVAMLVRFIGVQDEECSFTDVSKNHWAYKNIATATQAGWISGYTDGSFKPDQPITRAEAMSIINRVLNRGVNKDSTLLEFKMWPDNDASAWYYYDVIEASNEHEYTGSRPSENWTSLKID